jgi:aminomethyltransferase
MERIMLKKTPLYESHIAMSARMVEFGGWDMPVQYSGILDEHHAVRNAAGLFDISHMGRFLVIGPDTLSFLQRVATYDVAAIDVDKANYALLCNSYGGIVDDIFIYHLPNAYMLVVNAANRQKDWNWLLKHAANFNVRMVDYSDQWAMLALQGPAAEAIIAQAEPSQADILTSLPFHGVVKGRFLGIDECLIARTGYTGEDGFEIFFDATQAAKVWNHLLDVGKAHGLKPCGLGARDSLRFEPCLALYGHEIGDDINPYEARLGWVVKLNKGPFTGHDALEYMKSHGTSRRLTGFEMVGRGIARHGYPIHSTDGENIGYVTTGMPSPTLGKHLGMGYVPTALSQLESEFDIMIRNKPVRARVVKMPFYKPKYKK